MKYGIRPSTNRDYLRVGVSNAYRWAVYDRDTKKTVAISKSKRNALAVSKWFETIRATAEIVSGVLLIPDGN